MLLVNLAAVDTIHPLSSKFVTGVKIKATGDSKLNDSPGKSIFTQYPLSELAESELSCQ